MNTVNEGADVNNTLHESTENQDTPPDFQDREEEAAERAEAPEEETNGEATDYAALAMADVAELRGEFPELASLSSVTELDDPLRYGALRDLGLTPAEAYLATRRRPRADNRAHLRPTRSVARGSAPLMTEAEMNAARELFDGISDSEIRQLYKRVTK